MRNQFIPIINTKLKPPRLGHPVLTRPRLLNLFEKHKNQPLTLLMGPAGYGKTTLMTQWQDILISAGTKTAWLTLDDGDNIPDQFLSYLCSAFKKLEPSMSVQIEEFQDLGSARVPQAVIAELVNTLADQEKNYALFLDDYHCIDNENIHAILQYLISNLPLNLNLYIGTRSVPPLSLSRLKVSGQVHLLGSESLRFDQPEAEQFLLDRTNVALEPDELKALLERTEGWPAALQLASPSLAQLDEREAFIESFSGDHRSITDFLAEEVLNRLPERVLRLLLELSVVDRFTVSLCRVLTGQDDVQAILENPQSDYFLLQRFDDEDSWYRFHPLIRGFLRKRLDEREGKAVRALHEKAALWFEQRGLIAEGVEHMLSAGKQESALALIEKYAFDIIEQGQLALLISLVRKLPQGQIAGCEKILVPLAWAQLLSHNKYELQQLLDQMESLIEHTDAGQRQFIELEISVLRAALQAYLDDFTGCQATIARWPVQPVVESPFTEVTMDNTREYACLINYQFDDVYRWLQKSERLYDQLENPGTKVYGRLFSMIARLEQTRVSEMIAEGQGTLDICKAGKGVGSGAVFRKLTLLLKGVGHYYAGEPDKALAHFEANIETLKNYAVSEILIKVFPAIVRTYLQKNEYQKAQNLLNQIAFIASQRGLIRLQSCVLHEQVRALLLENNAVIAAQRFEQAEQLKELADVDVSGVEAQAWEWTRLAEVRLQIDSGPGLTTEQMLQQLETRFLSQGRSLRLLEIYLLQAQLASAQGDKKAALTALETAFLLPLDEQLIQPFVDEGRNLETLYRALVSETDNRSVLNRCNKVIERLEAISLTVPVTDEASLKGNIQGAKTGGLTDPLSKRELEVLKLVAEGLSNRDIAEQLFLSIDTIKTHLKSIFSKMSVARRTQAVNLGRDLKLIE
ncbi:LuxR C-terminal-related transcriptional regulator [Amphritea sp. HPY]|uniref:LuxR C-terminal-related transcriptional regulator n=1 Tax=Amphritea sp. HPY TaxID=3421652 RepID=UPI003D7D0387